MVIYIINESSAASVFQLKTNRKSYMLLFEAFSVAINQVVEEDINAIIIKQFKHIRKDSSKIYKNEIYLRKRLILLQQVS